MVVGVITIYLTLRKPTPQSRFPGDYHNSRMLYYTLRKVTPRSYFPGGIELLHITTLMPLHNIGKMALSHSTIFN